MLAYIIRRLGAAVVILFGSSYLLYNLAAYSGDPLEGLRTSTDPNAAQLIATLTRDLNLDTPPPLRYFLWLQDVLQLNLGGTRDGQEVINALSTAIPTTLRLVTGATFVAIFLGITIGIVTALRQYSRFDYSATFVAFLLFSLPIFWVAVLLKQYLAIQFNDFLADPNVTVGWLAGLALVSAVFWSSVIGGSRKTFWTSFAVAGFGSAGLIVLLESLNWFTNPRLGIIGIAAISVGLAFGVTQLSTGISSRPALISSLIMAGLGIASYFPAQAAFDSANPVRNTFLMLVFTVALGFVVPTFVTKIDRRPTIRTAVITGVTIGFFMVVDKLMQTWSPYMRTDAVSGRPVPTQGQNNVLLVTNDFWVKSLDTLVHMFLPTIALTLISFAGYTRYARGTMLEVANQDYIRTARAKGLTERTVVMRHAFRNTLIPLTTIMVADFAGIVGGAIITESVFGWFGMGSLFRQAITSQDLNLLMGVFLVTGTLTVLANLIADLLYSALDPRIRVGAGK